MKKPYKRPQPPRRRPVKHVPTPTEPAAEIHSRKQALRFQGRRSRAHRCFVSVPLALDADGKFPIALEVGGRCAWIESDIDAWMLSRPARNYKSREVA